MAARTWSPGFGRQDVAARIWSPGSGRQDVADRMLSPGSGRQYVATRMWSPGSGRQEVIQLQYSMRRKCRILRLKKNYWCPLLEKTEAKLTLRNLAIQQFNMLQLSANRNSGFHEFSKIKQTFRKV